jgi:hypothetical protein
LDSVILSSFPEILADFRGRPVSLLWRGTRDGFEPQDFHSRCDGHPNTFTVFIDMDGNTFGGFTPVEWTSKDVTKGDASLKSFLFTLKNPHGLPARRFTLKPERKGMAVSGYARYGPMFGDDLYADYSVAGVSQTVTSHLGQVYTNDTGLAGDTLLTGAAVTQVKEIEVFEITV